jgi:NADH-quinone oxidoreductase subunit J
VQVFIYVGAVMVLFLFAVMVLDVGREKLGQRLHNQSAFAVILVAALFFAMSALALRGRLTAPLGGYTEETLAKNTEVIGRALYTRYLYPFEVVSIVLLIALIGAVVLVMKDKKIEEGPRA